MGGGSQIFRSWSTGQLPRPSGQQSVTPAGSVHKSRGDNVIRMWVKLKSVTRGHSGDGCDLALSLCKYDVKKGDLFVLS